MSSNSSSKTYIYGKHAVHEALAHASHAIEKVFLAPQFDEPKLLSILKRTKITTSLLTQDELRKMSAHGITDETNHQGVVAEIRMEKLLKSYKEFADGLPAGADGKVTPDTALVILGELQDAQNIGAVIRSAAAFGIAGILIPEHNNAPINGAAIKVSAGMAFRIPLVTIGNINNAVRDLKERGFWIYGLEGEGKNSINKEKFDAPAVFILGNEATGIREKTLELCDVVLSIPTHPQCESLNAAASAAVTLYAWSREHWNALNTDNPH